MRTLSRCACSAADIASFDIGRIGVTTLPLDVLVPAQAAHQALPFARRWRTQGMFPPRSFYRIGNNVIVCCPELCFAQLARRLSTADLILLGYELCGAYALYPYVEEGFVGRPPLTSAAKLLDYLSKLDCRTGVKRARDAAREILDGSESPMESKLAAQLCTSTHRGGFALEGVALNAEVRVSAYDSTGRKTRMRRCDMLWEDARVAIEYDSSAHHSGTENIDRDARRRNQLVDRNLVVITVTKQQVYSFTRMEELAHLVAKQLGVRLRIRVRDFDTRRRELRKDLLKPNEQLVRPAIPQYDLPFWQ